jgi:hypothetical protein
MTTSTSFVCTPVILPPEVPYAENSFPKHYAAMMRTIILSLLPLLHLSTMRHQLVSQSDLIEHVFSNLQSNLIEPSIQLD